MAYRGRGRGRGRFGGGFGSYGIPEPFILFPEDVVLPDINDVKEETALVVANNKLLRYWKTSPYYLEKPTKKSGENDIERYSDGNKPNNRAKRLPLAHFLKLEDKYFPTELLLGKKKVEYNQSEGFSHQNKEQLKFDILENLERKYKDRESKGENEKKKENENGSDNEDPDDIEEESSEDSGDDYDMVENPDDDEDDYNVQEDDNPDDDNTY